MTLPDAAPARDANVPRSYALDGAGRFHRDLRPRELAELLRDPAAEAWVDVDSTNRHQLAVLEKVFQFHPLAIEDTLNPNSRVKIEEYDGHLFAVVRAVRFREETAEDPYDTETFNLNFFLGTNFVVTVHGEQSPVFAAVAERLVRNPDLLARGVERVMHGLMDGLMDQYFPVLDQIDGFVDTLEERVFTRSDRTVQHDIFLVKRLVLVLRRHLAPQREVFATLANRPSALIRPEAQVYFRDIYDHVLRITDSLENYRELLAGTMDSHLTQVSNRLGAVTKSLSVVATLSLPFVVVSGMWGMNFASIPLAQHPYGFWIMFAAQLGLGVALLLILLWRKVL